MNDASKVAMDPALQLGAKTQEGISPSQEVRRFLQGRTLSAGGRGRRYVEEVELDSGFENCMTFENVERSLVKI